LQASQHDQNFGVLDQSISGNRILHDIAGTNALGRLDRDVLSQTGVKYVTVLLGINDIGFSGIPGFTDQAVSDDDIIAGLTQLIERAHARGLRIYGCTLTPFEGTFPGYYTPKGEGKRETVNEWIRTSGAYDAVIDFDKAVRDPSHPTRMLPAYDSGDHLHPNDAGYMAMANAVDLSLFSQEEGDE
jgi:lysophospholipase L1-like esterase